MGDSLAIAERHVENERGCCDWCHKAWPCDAAVLAAELREARKYAVPAPHGWQERIDAATAERDEFAEALTNVTTAAEDAVRRADAAEAELREARASKAEYIAAAEAAMEVLVRQRDDLVDGPLREARAERDAMERERATHAQQNLDLHTRIYSLAAIRERAQEVMAGPASTPYATEIRNQVAAFILGDAVPSPEPDWHDHYPEFAAPSVEGQHGDD